MSNEPIIRFDQLVPGRTPKIGSRDVSGTLPIAALKHCKPVQEANTYGYSVYLPYSIALRWDGAAAMEMSCDYPSGSLGAEWFTLMPRCFYPDFNEIWEQHAPKPTPPIPPFVTFTEDPAMVQIWPGCFVTTRPEWSVLVRQPPNDLRKSDGYDIVEGILPSDRWGGPLTVMLRIKKTDTNIFIPSHRPFAHVVPVRRSDYDWRHLQNFEVSQGLSAVPPTRWWRYLEWANRLANAERRGEQLIEENHRWKAEPWPSS